MCLYHETFFRNHTGSSRKYGRQNTIDERAIFVMKKNFIRLLLFSKHYSESTCISPKAQASLVAQTVKRMLYPTMWETRV